MGKIFKNSNNEFRSGWKIAGVILLYSILSFMATIITNIIIIVINNGKSVSQLGGSTDFINDGTLQTLLDQAIDFICIFLSINCALKIENKNTLNDIGFISIKKVYKNFILGLLLGIISISFIFFTLLVTKNISITNLSNPKFSMDTFIGLIIFIIVGIKEELLSRGYCINVLSQMNNQWLPIIISSIIFSALHLINPNVRILGLINIAFIGILFGYMYVKTRNLWMPIGYHITWNYFQGFIYGFHVSGLNAQGIFSCNIVKDNILTGGAFGPEASMLTTIVIILGLLVVWKLNLDDCTKRNLISLKRNFRY